MPASARLSSHNAIAACRFESDRKSGDGLFAVDTTKLDAVYRENGTTRGIPRKMYRFTLVN